MPLPFSAALRQTVLFKLQSGQKDKAIIAETSISVRQMRKMRRNWERYGEVVRPTKSGGRPRKLGRLQEEKLLLFKTQRPTASLDDMQQLLRDDFNLAVEKCTISRALKRLMGNHRKEAVRRAKPGNVTSGQIPTTTTTTTATSNSIPLDPSLSTTFHLPQFNNNVQFTPNPPAPAPPPSTIPISPLQHTFPLTQMSSLFGIVLPPRPVHTTPLIISPTQCAFTFPSSPSFTHMVAFLLPGAALPPDTLAGIYIQLPRSNNGGAFTLLGALGNDQPSAIFPITSTGAADAAPLEDDMIDIDSSSTSRLDVTVGISVEPATTLALQLAAIKDFAYPSLSSSSSAMVLASRAIAAGAPVPTKILAQRIIRNAFNFLASFAGTSGGSGEEVVPLRQFREWWTKFERRVENDPGFLERNVDA